MRELQFIHMDTGWRQRTSTGCSHLRPEGAGHSDQTFLDPSSCSENSCGQGLGCAQRGLRLLTAEWTVPESRGLGAI